MVDTWRFRGSEVALRKGAFDHGSLALLQKCPQCHHHAMLVVIGGDDIFTSTTITTITTSTTITIIILR